MPIILTGDQSGGLNRGTGGVLGNLRGAQYKYTYPFNLNLKPGSPRHQELLSTVLQCARESRRAISKRYSSWQLIDQTLTAFIPVDEEERKVKLKDRRKPISIVVPLSYATMETLLTYLVSAFLEDPIFHYEGAGPEDTIGAALLELVVGYQTRRAKMGLALHTMWRDSLAYGIGFVTPVWKRTYMNQTSIEDGVRFTSERISYEGNVLYNIDPYMVLPDPHTPIHLLQEGEYFGWIRRTNRQTILAEELDNKFAFNGQYLKHIDGRSQLFNNNEYRDRYAVGNSRTSGENTMDEVNMYMNIIPSEWKLGRSNYPEKWLFTIVGDQVVTKAQPLNLDHNQFPVAVVAPSFDGYTVSPISNLEMLYGLQEIVDFLYNSHITNVRKAINDMFVIDPNRINVNDMLNPEGGMLVRLRQKAWGEGVENAIKQLNVSDVTSNHIGDALYISDIISKVSGATDGLSGIPQKTGERVSATEARNTHGSALSRLEKAARIASLQGMSDLAYMIASQTQQLMTREQSVKITGRSAEALQQTLQSDYMMVDPNKLLINYDVVYHDGTVPSSGDPQLWSNMLAMITKSPEMMAKLDVTRIFKYWARMSGARNIEDFTVKAQVQPDAQVQQQVQAGNLIPMLQSEMGEMPQ